MRRHNHRHSWHHLLLIMVLVLGCATTVFAENIDSTGNLVRPTTTSTGSTWTNAVYQDNLTCWEPGGPGYCGPNAIVRPGGNINFSYGTTDIYQQVNIAQALPNSGTGLLIRGYSFSYVAKVGNGWDDGRWDFLQSYVQLRGPTGDLKSVQVYTHNTTHDWSSFNLSRSFPDNRFTTQDLATARFGFVGRDNNYQAGPYGPEVNSVSFSLQYMRDPCVTNQLSSPQCPKFMETLNQMSVIPSMALTPPVSALTTVANTSEQSSSSNVIGLVTASSSNNSSQSTNGSAAANPAAQSFAVSLIRSNQQRESQLAGSASAAAVAEAAAAAETAQREAERVADSARELSMLSTADSSAQTSQQQSITATAVSMAIPAFTINLPMAQSTVKNESTVDSSMAQTNTAIIQPNSAQANPTAWADTTALETGSTNEAPSARPQITNNTVVEYTETTNTNSTQSARVSTAINSRPAAETTEVEISGVLQILQPNAATSVTSGSEIVEIQPADGLMAVRPPLSVVNTGSTESADISTMSLSNTPMPQSALIVSTVNDNANQTNELTTTSPAPARNSFVPDSQSGNDLPVVVYSVPTPRIETNSLSTVAVPEPNLPNTSAAVIASTAPIPRENDSAPLPVEAVSVPPMATIFPAADTNQLAQPILPPVVQTEPIQNQQAVASMPSTYVAPQTLEIDIINSQHTVEISIPVIQVALPAVRATETPTVENTAASSRNFTTNKTDPITAIVEQRSELPTGTAPVFAGPVVNTRAADSELAGGRSIDSIAKTAPALDLYASLRLQDAAFYAPREIYRGQRNVDNVRALRNLAQETRHQEMVDQQYRR